MKASIVALCLLAAFTVSVSAETRQIDEKLMSELRSSSKEELQNLLAAFQKRYAEARASGDTEQQLYAFSVIRLIKSLIYHNSRLATYPVDIAERSIARTRASIDFLEDRLTQTESRDAFTALTSGIEIAKLMVIRAEQMVAAIRDVAAKMEREGHKEVGDHLRLLADTILDAQKKAADFVSRTDKEGRQKLLARVEGALDLADTVLGIADKLSFIPKVKDTQKVVDALRSLTKAFKGEETVTADEKALEELLSVTGVPELLKAARVALKYISNFLKLVGMGDSEVNKFVKSSQKVVDATMVVYADAFDKASEVTQSPWKDLAKGIKDKFIKLFSPSKKN